MGEAGAYVAAVGQEDVSADGSGPQAYEEQETRGSGDAGAFAVRLEFSVAQSGESRAVGVRAGVPDGGEPVRSAVGVCGVTTISREAKARTDSRDVRPSIVIKPDSRSCAAIASTEYAARTST